MTNGNMIFFFWLANDLVSSGFFNLQIKKWHFRSRELVQALRAEIVRENVQSEWTHGEGAHTFLRRKP